MQEGEIEIHLRFTINKWGTDRRPRDYELISNFQFNGGNFDLFYRYYEEGIHAHYLVKKFGKRRPMDVFVQVESGGRIVTELSGYRHYPNTSNSWAGYFWRKQAHEIQQAVPDFRNQPLTWIIVLKEGILQEDAVQNKAAASKAVAANQEKRSIHERFERSCMESLSADFARLMARETDHDVTFMCESQSIVAHGAVVCARSKVLNRMLGSDMLEGRTRVITIPEVEPDVFRHFLRYLYCGKVDSELTYDVALTLYELGDQYFVFGLFKRCSQLLSKHLSPENAWDVLVIANLHSNGDFEKKIITYLIDSEDDRVAKGWPAFREKHPELALKINEQETKRICHKKKFYFRYLRSCN